MHMSVPKYVNRYPKELLKETARLRTGASPSDQSLVLRLVKILEFAAPVRQIREKKQQE